MASTTPNKILLQVNGAGVEARPIFEYEADEALTPGELVRFDADDELEPHGTAGGNALPIFVVENPYAETAAGAKAIDTDYALGSYARVIYAQPGDLVYDWLADGQNVAKGAALVSDGAGALQSGGTQAVDEGGTVTYTVYTDSVVGYADQDLNNSAGGARARIKVRVA